MLEERIYGLDRLTSRVDSVSVPRVPSRQKSLMDGESDGALGRDGPSTPERERSSVAALVVGLPATFDEDMDFVVRCNNVPGLAGRKLADELRARLGCPVLLEHDLMLHLLGETSLLDCSDSPTSLGVYFGTGIGGDVLLHDEPYRLYKTGFELGHIPYRTGGRLCVCGKRGCMEAYSNGHLLVALAEEHEIEIADIFCHWGTRGAMMKPYGTSLMLKRNASPPQSCCSLPSIQSSAVES